MVGMAVLAASTILTAILLFELTRDYRIVLPLMAAVGLCSLVERIQPNSTSRGIYQLGLNVQKDQQTEILSNSGGGGMHQSPLMLPAALPVLQAGSAMTRVCRSALVIDEAEHLVGIVTLKILTELFLFGNSMRSPKAKYKVTHLTEADGNLPYQSSLTFVPTEILYAYTG